MKTSIKVFVAAAALLFSVSCNKDNEADAILPAAEVITKLDEAGSVALEQIEPEDFRNAIYFTKDGIIVLKKNGKEPTESRNQWRKQMEAFWVRNDGQHNIYTFDGNKFAGNANLTIPTSSGDTTLDYNYEQHKTPPFTFAVSSSVNYSGELKVTTDAKDSIKIGLYGKTIDSLYTHLPIAVSGSVQIKDTDEDYLTLNLTTDFSKMAGLDLSDFSSLGKWEFSIGGDININGENSYKIKINNFSVAKQKLSAEITLNGKDGNQLLVATGSASIEEGESILPEIKVGEISLNLLNGAVVGKINDGIISIYLAGYNNAQMNINPETDAVNFADGTVSTVDKVFTEEYFSKSVVEAMRIIIEFYEILESL